MDNTFVENGNAMQPPNDSSESMPVLAMAYVPMQRLNSMYEPEDGFIIGTIFPELDKPWMPKGCEK